MKRIMCLGLVACLATAVPVVGQEGTEAPSDLTDPIKILKKVDVTIKKVKAVRYHAQTEYEGAAASQLPKVDVDVVFAGEGRIPKQYRIEGKIQLAGSDQWQEMSTGRESAGFYYVDVARKTAHVDGLPTVVGRLGGWVRGVAVMIEFTHANPFSDEINAVKAELIETATVGDEECYHVEVQYRDAGGQIAHWYFSKKDFLPRRVDRLSPMSGGGTSCQRLILTNLEVDPKVDKDTFAAAVPEGFATTSATMK